MPPWNETRNFEEISRKFRKIFKKCENFAKSLLPAKKNSQKSRFFRDKRLSQNRAKKCDLPFLTPKKVVPPKGKNRPFSPRLPKWGGHPQMTPIKNGIHHIYRIDFIIARSAIMGNKARKHPTGYTLFWLNPQKCQM